MITMANSFKKKNNKGDCKDNRESPTRDVSTFNLILKSKLKKFYILKSTYLLLKRWGRRGTITELKKRC